MNPIKVLRRVRPKKIWEVIRLGFSYPLFVLPTLNATKECMSISTSLYGKTHYKNGPANAFRHAFWNYLIAKRCFALRENEKKVLRWTKKITDWHEEAFRNRDLAKKMDLHNNDVGRFLFQKYVSKMKKEVLETLQQMTSNAVQVDDKSDLSKYKNTLVYITTES